MALPGLVKANNLNDVVNKEQAWDFLGSGLTADIDLPSPTLDLNFAGNKSLIDNISGQNLITFTRASSATYVDSDGLIKTAAPGVPRFDHDPATGESLGLLVEEARTNLIPNSQNLSSGYLQNNVIIQSGYLAPDGTNTAYKLIKPSGYSGWSYLLVSPGLGLSGTYTYSIFVKDAGAGFATFQNNPTFYFNTETFAYQQSGTYFERCSNGWYRIIVPSTDQTNPLFGFNVGVPFTGDGNKGALFWGLQIELGSFVTSYIPTTSTAVTRAADSVSITGANFSQWYNSTEGVFLWKGIYNNSIGGNDAIFTVTNSSAVNNNRFSIRAYNTLATSNGSEMFSNWSTGTPPVGINYKISFAYQIHSYALAAAGTISNTSSSASIPSGLNQIEFNKIEGDVIRNSVTLNRFTCYPKRLQNSALQALTASSSDNISSYSLNYSIKGKDILALENVRNASTKDFVSLKGLSSFVQPRLSSAATVTASGELRRDNAMLKLAPTTSGTYLFNTGLTLSGTTLSINGTRARSLSTSAFSGSTALCPIVLGEMRPQSNWRITEPMPSGTIASPDLGVLYETDEFLFFMKAGQS